jgi:hypothetical protein
MNNNNASIANNRPDTSPLSVSGRMGVQRPNQPISLKSDQTTNSINTYFPQQGQGVIDLDLHGEQAY